MDNKVFQRWFICAYTQSLNRDVKVVLRTCTEIPNSDFGVAKSSNAGLFALIRKALIETWKFFAYKRRNS